MTVSFTEIAVIGAGVSGLACAGTLKAFGASVQVFDRARGVGGRCATRRLDEANGQAVDYGVAFFHGKSTAFLQALAAVDSEPIPGWPARISGTGSPCQPRAFSPGEKRLAFRAGVSAFPKHLAGDLDLALGTHVASLGPEPDGITLRDDSGQAVMRARTVVLALALEQSRQLVDTLPATAGDEGKAVRALLNLEKSLPCLTVIAGYPLDAPQPAWDVAYPESSTVLSMASHDSAKRAHPSHRILVLQAQPRWSRERLAAGDPEEQWAASILNEAGRLWGDWAARPVFHRAHRWKYARVGAAGELAGPLVWDLQPRCTLGVCGDLFSSGGGVEAAYVSGLNLAERLITRGTVSI